ncbi:alpha/beta hydrolase [Pyrococcus abyssi]|uniref:2-acetyl-1-alkylglycerophosph ocholine esterase n=1 Tax=Pyrococcus abyssi (strain GE5 / Orsay) TaxID=272844 RepID=Q9V211_PYRAB|nr:alpha/beta hydrolase [Pyrococcus abyssi]CAB49187.1 Hypothetical 2-acetyl-1-alkylglycerophosphocholine esterase [Pyrococcus abyssi GE5]CCE69640.1 TPA: 2-acetyl-1-alkylglycerophosph ocholine esterase [Pyrococcus abyssi GE5]
MIWTWTILLFLTIIFGFFAFVGYKMVTPPRRVGKWTPKDLGFDYEKVEFKSRDGITLRGWWIDQGKDETVIVLHGYTASKWNEVYMKPAIEIVANLGYNVLTFDFRAHGESEGSKTTIGDKEILDLSGAIDWLLSNTNTKKIALIGFSMGAMVTIRALAEDERVCCGIADSPPIYIDKTGARGLKYFANLPEFLYPIIKPFTKMFSGAKEVNIIDYADKVRKPLLIIAGGNDPLVKVEEVEEFYKRNKTINPRIEVWITDAAHVRTIVKYKEEWKRKVGEFLRANL